MTKPNLFKYATGELSQDAVLCWLFSWGDPQQSSEDEALHRLGKALIEAMLSASQAPPVDRIKEISVHRQYHSIDIVVEVNDTHVLVIEDKVDTGLHSDQLHRYQQLVKTDFPDRAHGFVYLKVGDQSSYNAVERQGWTAFQRSDLLGVIGGAADRAENDILNDYVAHLQRIEKAVASFRSRPVSEWSARAWRGFFMALQDELGQGEWSYVPNASGGFMGFWWGFHQVQGGEVYLQLEEQRLVAKVGVPNKVERSAVRNRWSRIVREGVSSPPFYRPKRFGYGRWMTVANADPYIRVKKGLLDLDATIAFLLRATNAISEVVASVEEQEL